MLIVLPVRNREGDVHANIFYRASRISSGFWTSLVFIAKFESIDADDFFQLYRSCIRVLPKQVNSCWRQAHQDNKATINMILKFHRDKYSTYVNSINGKEPEASKHNKESISINI